MYNYLNFYLAINQKTFNPKIVEIHLIEEKQKFLFQFYLNSFYKIKRVNIFAMLCKSRESRNKSHMYILERLLVLQVCSLW